MLHSNVHSRSNLLYEIIKGEVYEAHDNTKVTAFVF